MKIIKSIIFFVFSTVLIGIGMAYGCPDTDYVIIGNDMPLVNEPIDVYYAYDDSNPDYWWFEEAWVIDGVDYSSLPDPLKFSTAEEH
ncbi:MAG: hypothetical protein V1752_02805, partial [Candidatus Firestonebacteria bacterium]